jgi:hypothetical protein
VPPTQGVKALRLCTEQVSDGFLQPLYERRHLCGIDDQGASLFTGFEPDLSVFRVEGLRSSMVEIRFTAILLQRAWHKDSEDPNQDSCDAPMPDLLRC